MQNSFRKKRNWILSSLLIVALVITGAIWSNFATNKLLQRYSALQSKIVYDRHGEVIKIQPNQNGNYCLHAKSPPEIKKLIIQKEDRYFYSHIGFNPVSIFKAAKEKMIYGTNRASSTITQQLVKVLLGNEQNRTFRNKLIELFYAVGLEISTDKEMILDMYANSIYLGNQIQGVHLASRYYFDKLPSRLTPTENLQLVSSISAPSFSHPFTNQNIKSSKRLIKRLEIKNTEVKQISSEIISERKNIFANYASNESYFEYKNLPEQCNNSTLDNDLTHKIRQIVINNLQNLFEKNAENAAVIVIKYPENEVIAMIGSPDSTQTKSGNQINMAMQPRPIGSTIKPFLYGYGFSLGLRPYTLVDDREYKFTTKGGYAHYPKNYDYQYNGIVSLHESLSNSLNIPAVKVLEFIGLEEFYKFLLEDLQVEPRQSLENYQYGIALGQLEMSLFELAQRFSIFAHAGDLKDLQYCQNSEAQTITKETISDEYIQLVNRVLIDRDAASDQFGLVGNIRVPGKKIAVKTGTSERYHDSWTIGYTPDFLVGVWVGNADNQSMEEVSGQEGAGLIWRDVVMLLLESEYNRNSEFNFDEINLFPNEENMEIGLYGDDFNYHQNTMLEKKIIIFPHDNDEYLYISGMRIPLEAEDVVDWYIDGKLYQTAQKTEYLVVEEGEILIKAVDNSDGKTEEVVVFVNKEE